MGSDSKPIDDNGSMETKEIDGDQTVNEKNGKRGRPKSPCEPIESEPYINIEIVKYGRDPNNTFSSGK